MQSFVVMFVLKSAKSFELMCLHKDEINRIKMLKIFYVLIMASDSLSMPKYMTDITVSKC